MAAFELLPEASPKVVREKTLAVPKSMKSDLIKPLAESFLEVQAVKMGFESLRKTDVGNVRAISAIALLLTENLNSSTTRLLERNFWVEVQVVVRTLRDALADPLRMLENESLDPDIQEKTIAHVMDTYRRLVELPAVLSLRETSSGSVIDLSKIILTRKSA